MKRAILWIFALAVLGALGYAAFRLHDERRFATAPFGEGARTVIVPPGSGPHSLARLLAEARVVSDEQRFYTHLHWFRRSAQPKAGEYEFDGALTPDEVLGKLVRGTSGGAAASFRRADQSSRSPGCASICPSRTSQTCVASPFTKLRLCETKSSVPW